ncbi:hypothetical protein CDG79_33730 [Nostoc sp. 'Peltigera membranacea cyanobiont' 232]|nr:hypothetical protein CDG79_33730 [Nostoc sp. 'Peltigera membranacea cyanobiont' 232]
MNLISYQKNCFFANINYLENCNVATLLIYVAGIKTSIFGKMLQQLLQHFALVILMNNKNQVSNRPKTVVFLVFDDGVKSRCNRVAVTDKNVAEGRCNNVAD